MNEQYDNLIYYALCEILYDEMRRTNYVTFHSLCSSIKICLENKTALSTEQYKLLSKTISKVTYLYGMHEEETAKYVANFFGQEKWTIYIDCVVVFKNSLKNSFN